MNDLHPVNSLPERHDPKESPLFLTLYLQNIVGIEENRQSCHNNLEIRVLTCHLKVNKNRLKRAL